MCAWAHSSHVRTKPCIVALVDLPSGIEALRAEAAGEGFNFVENLIADWRSGKNRFARPGEVFLGVFQANDLFAIGGLNLDPYVNREGVGRLRHLYVKPSARRTGVGSALVRQVLHHAASTFHLVRLRTDTPEAGEFYIRLGFCPVQDETATHVMSLRGAQVSCLAYC